MTHELKSISKKASRMSSEKVEEFNKMCKAKGLSQPDMIEFLMDYYKSGMSKAKSVSNEQIMNKNSNKKGAAFARVELFYDAIKAYNKKQKEKYKGNESELLKHIVYIGQSLTRKQIGTNAATLKEFFKAYEGDIYQYYKELIHSIVKEKESLARSEYRQMEKQSKKGIELPKFKTAKALGGENYYIKEVVSNWMSRNINLWLRGEKKVQGTEKLEIIEKIIQDSEHAKLLRPKSE